MCNHKNCLDDAFLMKTHNITFDDEIRPKPSYIFGYLELWSTEEGVQMNNGKRVISVRVFELLPYLFSLTFLHSFFQ